MSTAPVQRPAPTHYRDRAAALVDRLPAVVVLPRRSPASTPAAAAQRPRPRPEAPRRQLSLPL